MIFCICLNPAVDMTCRMDASFRAGGVNRLTEMMPFAGGKGVNVARFLRQFGADVCISGFLGGANGKVIEGVLEAEGAECCFTMVRGNTRCNRNIIDSAGNVTEVLESGPFVGPDQILSFMETFQDRLNDAEILIISGSVPQSVPSDIYATMLKIAAAKKVPAIIDTTGGSLRAAMKECPMMIKPNLSEFTSYLGKDISGRDDAIKAMDDLIYQKKASSILLSRGRDGLIYSNREIRICAEGIKLNAVNTVSCGDAAVAGYAYSYIRGADIRECVSQALLWSASAALKEESGQLDISFVKENEKNINLYTI